MRDIGTITLWALVVLIYSILGLHLLAETFFLYWTYAWFDILMHYLGGLWLGLAIAWVIYLSGYIPPEKRPGHPFLTIMTWLLFVSFLWEVFEYVTFTYFELPVFDEYTFDTGLDFVMDALGGMTAYAFLRKFLHRDTEQTPVDPALS